MKIELELESCSVVSDSLRSHGLHSPWNSAGQNTGVGSYSLLQGIFPTQVSNPGLLHRRWILYWLSHSMNIRCCKMARQNVCNKYLLQASKQSHNPTSVEGLSVGMIIYNFCHSGWDLDQALCKSTPRCQLFSEQNKKDT